MPDMKTAFAKALSAGSAKADHQRYCDNLKQGLDENQCKVIDAMLAAKCKWVSRGWIRKALKPQGINEVGCGLILNTLIRDKLVIVHEKDLYYLSLPDPFELLRRLAVEALPTARDVMIADRMLMNSRLTMMLTDPSIESISVNENAEGLVSYEVEMTASEVVVETFPRPINEKERGYVIDTCRGIQREILPSLQRDSFGNVYAEVTRTPLFPEMTVESQIAWAMCVGETTSDLTYLDSDGELIRPLIARHEGTDNICVFLQPVSFMCIDTFLQDYLEDNPDE